MTDANTKSLICKELLHVAGQLQSMAKGTWSDRTAVIEIGQHIRALEDIQRRLKEPEQITD
jgi:hypothetical protein